MKLYDEVELQSDLEIGVHYNYEEGEPSVQHYGDGTGYPGSPPEVEITEINLIKGSLTDLVLHIGNQDGFIEWLETQLYIIND